MIDQVEVWMKEWLIVLNSTGTDGPVLSVLFNGGDTNIFERDGVYYLRSTAFDGLTDPREVYEKGLSLLPVVNGAAMLQIGHYSPVTPSAVASLDDGRLEVFANPVAFEMRSSLFTQGTIGTAPPAAQSWLALAQQQQHEDVQLALYHFAPPHDWVKLYRVFEIICDDLGRTPGMEDKHVVPAGRNQIMTNGWATEPDVGRFGDAANNRFISGPDARHANDNKRRYPTLPDMPLPEAVTFVSTLLTNWLATK